MGRDDSEGATAEPISRRVFVQGLGAAALVCPLLASCEFVEVFEDLELEDARFELSDPQFSALEDIGGTACIEAGNLELLLIRKDRQNVLAVERFCPHEQLSMGPCQDNPVPAMWDADDEQLTCMWHGSVFDADGQVVDGPSPRALKVFPVDFDPAAGEGVVRAGGERQGESS